MEFFKALSVLIMIILEIIMYWSLCQDKKSEFRKIGYIIIILIAIPLIYIIIK